MIFDNIKKRCSEKNLKINDLESAVGLGINTIYKWKNCDPSASNLKLVADYLGCTVDELLSDEKGV